MINETRCKTFQNAYMVSLSPVILVLLQREVEAIAKPLCVIQVKKTGGWISTERVDEIAYESSTRFMEMYLKNPNWYCTSFRNRIYLEVLYFLYSKKARAIEEEALPYNLTIDIPDQLEDVNYVLEDIMFDTPYWRNVFIDCYRSRRYKEFILKCTQYVSKQWIYDHAIRLRKLFLYTRREK